MSNENKSNSDDDNLFEDFFKSSDANDTSTGGAVSDANVSKEQGNDPVVSSDESELINEVKDESHAYTESGSLGSGTYNSDDDEEDVYVFEDEEYSDDSGDTEQMAENVGEEQGYEHTETVGDAKSSSFKGTMDMLLSNAKSSCHVLSDKLPGVFNRRVMGAFGVAFVLYCGLHIWNHHRSTSADINAHQAAPAQTQVAPTASASSQLQEQQNQVQDTLNNQKDNISTLTNEADSLKDSIDQLKSQQSQLQSSVSSLSDQISRMNQAMTLLSKQVYANKDKLTPKSSSKSNEKKQPEITYYMKAIVPGRAWIYSSNGGSTSVAVGDTVNDHYGAVTAIDVDQGTVTTSKGLVIKYEANNK